MIAVEIAPLRFKVSADNALEIAELVETRDETESDTPLEIELIWLFRKLVSVVSALFCKVIDALIGTTALFMDVDAEETALLRADISVLRVALMLEFVEVNADTDALAEPESDVMDVVRVVTSVAKAMEN